MGLLQKATNQMAFLKAGLQGSAGSGKTMTSAMIAIGLAKLSEKKTVAFCDSESGTDYLIPLFERNGVELLRVKTESFSDLCEFMREAEKVAAAAIVDSITAYWKNLLWTYRYEKVKKRLANKGWFGNKSSSEQEEIIIRDAKSMRLLMNDWAPIKDTWAEFSSLYLDTQMHCTVCGRLGFDWDFERDEEGNKELVKVGTKMKTEGEMAYEPSLLLEMEIIKPRGDLERKKGSPRKQRSAWIHQCTVLKDRTDLLNGKVIDNPSFDDFTPIIEWLNIGGQHVAIERPTNGNGESMFSDSGNSKAGEYRKQCEIVEEQIRELLVLAELNGTGKAETKQRTEELRKAFGTSSSTAIKSMKLEELKNGHAVLAKNLKIDLAVPDGKEIEAKSEEKDWSKVGPPAIQDEPPPNDDDIPM